MKLKIRDYNRGQIPSTIKNAIYISGYSRYMVEKLLNEQDVIKVNHNGFYFGIEKKIQLTADETQEMLDTQEPDEYMGYDGTLYPAIHSRIFINIPIDEEPLPF